MIFSVICLQDNWNYCKFAKAAMKNKTGSNNIIQTLKYKSIMTKKGEIYICKHCGGMVEVLKEGAVPVCCGEPMKLLKENTTDGAKEKHVPVVEKIEGGYRSSPPTASCAVSSHPRTSPWQSSRPTPPR